MAEMISEPKIFDQNNDRIKEIDVTIDEAQVAEFVQTLKGDQYNEVRKFLTGLRTRIADLSTQAEVHRMNQENAPFQQGNVGGISVTPTGNNANIDKHNQEVERIYTGIVAFREKRDAFLRDFSIKYMPESLRSDYERRRMEEHNRNLRTQPRVARQFGPNFIATSGDTPSAPRKRPEDDEQYMETLLAKDVESMTDEEIDKVKDIYRRQGFGNLYVELVSNGMGEKAALNEIRLRMQKVFAEYNNTPFNQKLIAFANWLNKKSKK